MLERIKAVLEMYSAVSSFERLVRESFAKNSQGEVLILRALRAAQRAHNGHKRLDGKPILSHPLAVATLLMVFHEVRDPSVIAAALLHLFIEDVEGWNFHRLHRVFGFRVAEGVWFVSKEGEDKDEPEGRWAIRTSLSHDKLLHAPLEIQKLKLCDRFNNLLSIEFLPKWKQKRMLRDTVDFYAPLSKTIGAFEEELLEAVKLASRAD